MKLLFYFSFIISSNDNPYVSALFVLKLLPTPSSITTFTAKKYHPILSNLMATQGSAPNLVANSIICCKSSLLKNKFPVLTFLHSIASFLPCFPATTSTAGYFMLPDPATLTAAHFSVFQNICIISLSAELPLLLVDIVV